MRMVFMETRVSIKNRIIPARYMNPTGAEPFAAFCQFSTPVVEYSAAPIPRNA